jgi:hypothetical protein
MAPRAVRMPAKSDLEVETFHRVVTTVVAAVLPEPRP